MKIIKKIIAIIVLCVQFIILGNSVNAANINEIKDLERGEKGYYCVQKWDGSKWIYLTYNRTYYTDTDGKKYIAYCLSPGLPGVGYVSGEKETYQVKIKEILNNDIVWRIIKNGYPSKSVEQLGVETPDDAYFATMQAINCVLRGYTIEQAKQLYTPGQFAINNESLTDIQRRGTKTLNAMYNLIDIGLNGTEKRSDLLSVSVKKVTEFVKENNDYYSQTFKIESSSEISEYTITNLEKFPQGSYISDTKGNKKTTFKQGENFKIMIPKNKILNDVNGKINVKVKQKNYPVFYSSAMIEGHQDYALCTNLYSEVYASTEVYVNSSKSKLIINKIDAETKNPIKGVKFQIKNGEGKVVGTFTTDEKGKITVENLKQSEVTIKEIEAVGKYKLNEKEQKVSIGYDEKKEIQVENKLKKGNIKIVKVDKDNQEIKLENVKFQLFDENGKLVKEGVTNKNGELIFENILIGKYKILEVKTNQEYILSKDEIVVNVEYNKTSEITIKNELKKGSVKVIKVDKDNNKIKIKDVKFQLLNENDKIIKEGVTDENGELIFNNIPIGKYKIIEVETQEKYVLSDKEIVVDIEYNNTKEIVLENELKKGNVKVIKTDKKDEKIKLENVKFQLVDEKGKVIKEGVTDKNGELLFEDIVIGKYKIVEMETNQDYILLDEEIIVNIKYNETIALKIENEKVPEEPKTPQEPEKPEEVIENKELPKTGVTSNIYGNIINGVMIIIITVIGVIRKRLKNKA